jgi:hypothetical protein
MTLKSPNGKYQTVLLRCTLFVRHVTIPHEIRPSPNRRGQSARPLQAPRARCSSIQITDWGTKHSPHMSGLLKRSV